EYGRYMRGLKSILGTTLMCEKRRLLNERLDFIEITARFLQHLKSRAEEATGQSFSHVVSGRPVRFHDRHPERDAQAQADLREAYEAAGFTGVRFLHEPEAAARAYAGQLAPGTTAMVVDIGGGTSDFTTFRADPSGITVLASTGIRKGGTDFDRNLSIAHVMPYLGRGTEIRRALGDQTDPAPNRIFNELATWAKIPFLYSPETRRQVSDLARLAVEPERLARLQKVLEEEIGHDLAFAVEVGKIEANRGQGAIKLDIVEPGLSVPLSDAAVAATLAEDAHQIGQGALACANVAGCAPDDLDALVLVGGSSLMTIVTDVLEQTFPKVPQHRAAALTAVADGLALAAGDEF
ncbi:MAG: Hsp70 family protein, partial [Pseudomonadota bacterium]